MFEDLDNLESDVECSTFLCKDVIKDVCENSDGEVLHKITIYWVENAFNRVQMGFSCVQLLVDVIDRKSVV